MKHTLLLIALIAFLTVSLSGAELVLVQNGTPRVQIVIAAEKRPRMATLAALELQHHIQKISGARLPIVTSPDASVQVRIYVGKSPATEKLGVTDQDLKYGAYRIVSGPDWLVLLGERGRQEAASMTADQVACSISLGIVDNALACVFMRLSA